MLPQHPMPRLEAVGIGFGSARRATSRAGGGPRQPQHGAHPLADPQRLVACRRAAARSPSARCGGGEGEADRAEGQAAFAEEREPVGDRFERRKVATQEADVAKTCGGVDRCSRQRDLQPIVGQRAVEVCQRDRGLVEPARLRSTHASNQRIGAAYGDARRARDTRVRRRCRRPRCRRRQDARRAGVGGVAPHPLQRGPRASACARARSRSPSRSARPASANWRCAQPVGVRTGWARARAAATHRRASSASPTSSADDTRARWASGRTGGQRAVLVERDELIADRPASRRRKAPTPTRTIAGGCRPTGRRRRAARPCSGPRRTVGWSGRCRRRSARRPAPSSAASGPGRRGPAGPAPAPPPPPPGGRAGSSRSPAHRLSTSRLPRISASAWRSPSASARRAASTSSRAALGVARVAQGRCRAAAGARGAPRRGSRGAGPPRPTPARSCTATSADDCAASAAAAARRA